MITKMSSFNPCYRLSLRALSIQLLSGECRRAALTISQNHLLGNGLVPSDNRPFITFHIVDRVIGHHMALLGDKLYLICVYIIKIGKLRNGEK